MFQGLDVNGGTVIPSIIMSHRLTQDVPDGGANISEAVWVIAVSGANNG